MKLRIIKLTPEQLTALLQGKPSPLSGNLPSDLEVLDAKADLFSRQFSLVVRSDSFEDIAENIPIPELAPTTKSETKPAAAPNPTSSVLRFEPKPEPTPPETKPLIPKPTQPPLSRYAAKMENEFSPDQRKLLSFTVKDNCVVVKPVTFLKAEWEDINETVRSLGGRWVKGDIISYWEIPLQ
ncbi:MAG: hypothetical protein M1540_06185 [Candidatus Bathyarchaeota archaeon]|nr:hypothetical protein [Gammaproteobacteria bacterium]MCL5877383.1 hypothetical protein [Candidatus Bathyarchaeota archaeon]